MRQSRPQVVAGAVEKNLRLVFEPPERARVNDAGAVALKLSPISVALLRIFSAARVAGSLREWREGGALGRFHLFAGLPTVVHCQIIPPMSMLPLPRRSLGEGGSLPSVRGSSNRRSLPIIPPMSMLPLPRRSLGEGGSLPFPRAFSSRPSLGD